MNLDPVIRPATQADIEKFYDGPLDATIQAWAVDYEGRTVALAGVVRISKYAQLAFSEFLETDAPKITIYKTAVRLFEKIKQTGSVIIADPGQNNARIAKGAPAFLKRLGFQEIDGVYRWDNLLY